jgi:ATP-dependent helicase HepA
LSKQEFIPGQRWISNTEPDLGLGIVVESADRRVTISFPAGGERRTYAFENAPLSRVKYPVGEQVSDSDGEVVKVTAVEESHGLLVYHGTGDNGAAVQLDEVNLNSFVHFSKPQDKLFAGQIDKNSDYKLRIETLEHQHRHQGSPVYGLLGARVQLLPHQLYIASQVGQRHAPRVLLADEVGLGKTIEAGLIVHQQLLTGRAGRVLVLVPDSLVHQWLVEMLRRFNLRFTILDEDRCLALEEDSGVNPFDSAQLVICCLSLLANNPARQQQAVGSKWDLLVVDEAHHLQWSESAVSPEYLCVEAVARSCPGLLLLTATPEQLGVAGHFARLRLLDPDRYFDFQEFLQEEAAYQPVSQLLGHLERHESVGQLLADGELVEKLKDYLGDQALTILRDDVEDEARAIRQLIGKLLDRHGTGRVLFRNTRDAVEGFPERVLSTYPLAMPEAFVNACANAELTDQLQPETLLGENWLQLDPRVEWLVGFLKEKREEKILLICARAETARTLEERLRLREGIRSAVFHEDLSLVARDRAAAYFAEDYQGAQVLVCSEIGSEGRNFQFAHHLVLFDLPLAPDLLEQRIGRLDRIGQTRTVCTHVPFYSNSAQERLLRWLHEGINAFERVCQVGQAIFDEERERIEDSLHSPDSANFDALLKDTRQRAAQLSAELQEGRDRLLERNSCNPQQAAEIVEQVSEATRMLELADYMDRVFDHFGVEQEAHSLDSIVLHPGDHMLCHRFPGLPDDGLTGTYQRSRAIGREEMEFLTWEHPMVTGAMEMLIDGDYGNTAICTIQLPPLKPGTLLVELFYRFHCPAPKSLGVTRYLQQAFIRLLVDSNGNELGNILTFEKLNQLEQKVPVAAGIQLVRHAQPEISRLINVAEERIRAKRTSMVDQARAEAGRQLSGEMERLSALSQNNRNIRDEELEHLRSSLEQLDSSLSQAELKLDSLRIVVVADKTSS